MCILPSRRSAAKFRFRNRPSHSDIQSYIYSRLSYKAYPLLSVRCMPYEGVCPCHSDSKNRIKKSRKTMRWLWGLVGKRLMGPVARIVVITAGDFNVLALSRKYLLWLARNSASSRGSFSEPQANMMWHSSFSFFAHFWQQVTTSSRTPRKSWKMIPIRTENFDMRVLGP